MAQPGGFRQPREGAGVPYWTSRMRGACAAMLDHIMRILRALTRRAKITSILLLTLFIVGGALISLSEGKSMTPPKVAILDARFKILSAQMLRGDKTYYLPQDGNLFVRGEVRWGSSVEGKVRALIHKTGIGIDTLTPIRPGKGLGGHAFSIYYAFPESPTSSVSLVADLVGGDGKPYPLRSAAGAWGNSPERWTVWTLDSEPSVPTNYTLRLKTETDGTPVAELKFTDP